MHVNNKTYSLINVKAGNGMVEGDLDSLAPEHSKHLHPFAPAHNKFKASDKDQVLYEVHFYTNTSEAYSSHINIPLKNLSRVDVYDLDKEPTNKSKILSIVGITLATAGIVTVIIAASQASHAYDNTVSNINTSTSSGDLGTCSPQVYTMDNNKSELEGTLYSGAIYSSLERTDYLPLTNVHEGTDKLSMVVRGERNEELMVKNINLLQVTHSSSQDVLVDRKGNVLVYEKPVAPEYAFIGNDKDVLEDVSVRDEKYYSFTNAANGESSSDVLLDFKKPRGVSSGKLIIRAKNSLWSFYTFGQFKSLYGDSYNSMVVKKDKADAKKVLQCEIDQYLPLIVSVKQNNSWKTVDYFLTPGNAAPRDLIMEIDLADFENADHLQVRLQTAYMFWDLDYAAMDFSNINSGKTSYLPVSRLVKTGNAIDTVDLTKNEEPYMKVSSNEQLRLEFNISQHPGNDLKNSYFLVGNGYYHDNTRFEGKPQYKELLRFIGKGAFDKYSREKFEDILTALKDPTDNDLTAK
jgi:hypothetical protein